MKNILLASVICFVLTLAAAGQKGSVETDPKLWGERVPSEPPVEAPTDGWTKIGHTFGKTAEDIYYRDVQFHRDDDAVTAWLKFIPRTPVVPNRRLHIEAWAYYLQHVKIGCVAKTMSSDSSVMYDKQGGTVNDSQAAMASIFGATDKPIVPGSMGEIIWRRLCRRFYE